MSTMPENRRTHVAHNGNDDESTEHVDAVHIRFREKGPMKMYHCFDCSEYFNVASILDVFEHYVRKVHINYHCDCLYCYGKVYQYKDADSKLQYYHNCARWKRQIDK